MSRALIETWLTPQRSGNQFRNGAKPPSGLGSYDGGFSNAAI